MKDLKDEETVEAIEVAEDLTSHVATILAGVGVEVKKPGPASLTKIIPRL